MTCFDNTWHRRPCLLWLVWILTVFAVMFLILGLIFDQISAVSFLIASTPTFAGIEYSFTCGWNSFHGEGTGFNNELYSDCSRSDECTLQSQAGASWLAFGILSCIVALPFVLYGLVTDYYLGEFDKKKFCVSLCSCCCCRPGYTRVGLILMFCFEFVQLAGYWIGDQCGTDSFWIQNNLYQSKDSREDFTPVGGISMAFVIMSLLMIFTAFLLVFIYQYCISSQLPVGVQIERPKQIQKIEILAAKTAETIEKTQQPEPEATGIVPESEYFSPTLNVTHDKRNANTLQTSDYDRVLSISVSSSVNTDKNGSNSIIRDRNSSVSAVQNKNPRLRLSQTEGHKKGAKPNKPPPIPKPKANEKNNNSRPKGPPPKPSDK